MNPSRQSVRGAPPPKQQFDDLSKVIFVDSTILNYATFYPGKLLGSTLTVGNITNCEQIVELSVDATSYTYSKKSLRQKFKLTADNESSLPFSISDDNNGGNGKKTETIVNSEIKHEAWYIENPISKELTKRITLKLGPKAEQEFIVVVRSPTTNLKRSGGNLLSIINIGVLTYADEQFGLKDSFEDYLRVNYNNSMKEFLRDRKKLSSLQKMEILLAVKVDIPSITCQKELVDHDLNEKMIPLVIKKPSSVAL